MEREMDKIQNSNNPQTSEELKSSGGSFSSRGSIRIPWRESSMGRRSYTM